MLRHLIVTAALATIMITTAASATVISGAWSFEVDAWPLLNQNVPFPSPPAIGSATFSLDTAMPVEGAPVSNFTSNFGSAPPAYSYRDDLDTLAIVFNGPGFFIEAQYIDVSLHLIEPGVPPILYTVLLIPSLDVQIAAADFSGSFAPTVPEPSTWVMLLLGFAGFGFVAGHKREASNKTVAETRLRSP